MWSRSFGNLDSGFQSLVRFRIPSAGFRIPKPRIPDSTSKKFLDSGIRIPYMGRMESMFRIQGLPETLRSDNGPPFASQEFEGFREYLATDHKKGIERLYKTLKSHQNSRAGRKRLETRVADFLTTPHTVTSLSPAELLKGGSWEINPGQTH